MEAPSAHPQSLSLFLSSSLPVLTPVPEWGSCSSPGLARCPQFLSSPGLSQYSSDPHTEWDLSAFSTREQVLEAVRNLRYKGGNTFTGNSPCRALSTHRGKLFPWMMCSLGTGATGEQRKQKKAWGFFWKAVAQAPSLPLPRSSTHPRPGAESETRCWRPTGG